MRKISLPQKRKKLSFFDKKVAKKFGGFKKSTYLCAVKNY
jgi:hypothetical protein